MTAAPAPIFEPTTRAASRFAMFIGDADGNFPDSLLDRAEYLLPPRLRYGTGSRWSPVAEFDVDLSVAGWRFQDTITPVGHNRIVEVRRVDELGGVDELLFWGKIESQGQQVTGQGETLTLVVAPRTLFRGEGLLSMPVWDGLQSEVIDVAHTWVFNPEIDELNEPNRSTQQDEDHDDVFYFADPESFRTARSQNAQTQSRELWTIAQAVQRLCWSINPEETYWLNPTLSEIEDQIGHESDKLFRNHRLRMDIGFEEALDALLHPYGITWHWTFSGVLGDVETKLTFVKLGEGIEVDFHMQRLGESLDMNQTNVSEVSVEYDIVSHPNVIIGYSAPVQLEVSLNLMAGWDPQYDILDWGQINLASTPRDVGRKWVFNEAGDYNGYRLQVLTDSPLHGDVDYVLLSKRREPLPVLTLGDDGQPIGDNGYVLNFVRDVVLSGNFVNFKWSYSALKQEIGVMLEGRVAEAIWDEYQADANGRPLRLTCTIELDERVVHRAERREESPNGADLVLPLDLSHRFKRKLVLEHTGNDEFSVLHAARHCELKEVIAGAAGAAQFRMSRSVADDLKAGQRIAVLAVGANTGADDSERTRWEGTYTAKTIAADVVTIHEPIEDSEMAALGESLGNVGLNTAEEDCLWRLQEYVEKLRDEQDYAIVAVTVTMPGVDHSAYKLGDIVTGLQPRNVTFDAYKGGTARRPQIMGITLDLSGRQETKLSLEQHFPPMDKSEVLRDATS